MINNRKASSLMLANLEGQRQVDEEMREFDHSDQVIMMKLLEVFEKRLAAQKQAALQEARLSMLQAKQKASTSMSRSMGRTLP